MAMVGWSALQLQIVPSGSSPVATNQTQSNDLNAQIDLSAVLGDDAGFERQGVVQLTQLESFDSLPMLPYTACWRRRSFNQHTLSLGQNSGIAFQLHILRNEKACFYKLVCVVIGLNGSFSFCSIYKRSSIFVCSGSD